MMTDQDRNAGTPASHAAKDRQRRPSDGSGVWFRSWIGPLAGAGRGLRALLPALFAILLLAGWTPEAGAQSTTVSPAGVCEGQTTEVTYSNVGNASLNVSIRWGPQTVDRVA